MAKVALESGRLKGGRLAARGAGSLRNVLGGLETPPVRKFPCHEQSPKKRRGKHEALSEASAQSHIGRSLTFVWRCIGEVDKIWRRLCTR